METEDLLLSNFEKLMHDHRYEDKTTTHKVKDHRRNIEYITNKIPYNGVVVRYRLVHCSS